VIAAVAGSAIAAETKVSIAMRIATSRAV